MGDKVLEGVLFGEPDLETNLGDSLSDLMDLVENSTTGGTMQEVLHRCLKCNTLALEIKPKLYHCPECSFEWEAY